MKFQEENSFDVERNIADHPVALLPVGAVEAHGPHLPLGTDNQLAEKVTEKVAERVKGFQLPVLPFGQVWSLKNFPGSIHVENETLVAMIVDIGKSLHRQGFKLFVMINGHLGNQTALKMAARELFDVCPELRVYYLFYPGMGEKVKEIQETPRSHHAYFHACEIETSFMLYLAGDSVDMTRALTDIPDIPEEADYTPFPWEGFTESAVLGDATLATAEKGQHVLDYSIERMVHMIRDGLDKVEEQEE
ncbi:creatininase family protein [Thalassobacillus sp. CUG 92003]|uniref:creatininase family protein n=1 Tax=Thalassobacillus sp. CUG 92003 TaxID=2736641 RepID=UPI0015E6689E|nr:creatininase family protein [Thalassobacillus sp. CUG 92003]